MGGIEIVVLIAVIIAAGLLTLYVIRRGWLRHELQQTGPEYVWLAIIGPSNAESTEDTYQGAYVLLAAGLRMELMMAKRETPEVAGTYALDVVSRPRVTERVTYTTEGFRPYVDKIKSLKDFGRYAPYREGWLTMMSLSVHPEDVEEAVGVLEDAGLTVERPPGKHWWH